VGGATVGGVQQMLRRRLWRSSTYLVRSFSPTVLRSKAAARAQQLHCHCQVRSIVKQCDAIGGHNIGHAPVCQENVRELCTSEMNGTVSVGVSRNRSRN